MSYDYACTVTRVIDSDTLDLIIDVGFRLTATLRFRLLGVDAPELPTPAGVAARDFTAVWVAAHPQLRVTTHKTDSFGRWLADLYTAPPGLPTYLRDDLITAGHATVWRR